jgi:hypothetical protein
MKLWRALDPHSGGVEAQMEPWRVSRPVVADLHHFDEEQDPDPDRINVNSRILIHIKAKRGSGSAPTVYQLITEMKREERGNKNLHIEITVFELTITTVRNK